MDDTPNPPLSILFEKKLYVVRIREIANVGVNLHCFFIGISRIRREVVYRNLLYTSERGG